MDSFRRVIKGWLGKVLLGFVVVLFSLYGAESLMVILTQPKPVATVDGVDITAQQLSSRVENERNRLRSTMGEDIDSTLLDAEVIRPQVLQSIVDREIVTSLVASLGISAPIEVIGEWIRSMPQFQVDNQYSQAKFDAIIPQLGYTQAQFLRELNTDYTVSQFRKAIAETAILSAEQVRYLTALQDQQRSFKYATLQHQTVLKDIVVENADVKSYYESNLDDFLIPEQVQVKYITLSPKDFEKQQSVLEQITEDRLQTAYEQMKADLILKESEKKSAHILITSDPSDSVDQQRAQSEAKSLYEQLNQLSGDKLNQKFTEIAKEHSGDPGSASEGGLLGFAKKGAYVPEFEEVLWSLAVGEVSEPVKTQYGYHIIHLLEESNPSLPDYETVEQQLRDELINELSLAAYEDSLDTLKTLAFDHDTLVPAAEALSLPIQTSPLISKEGFQPNTLSYPFHELSVVELVFSDDVTEGYNSEVLEVTYQDQSSAIVVHLVEKWPQRTRSFEEVSLKIETQIKQSMASKQVEVKGREIIAEVRAGAPLEDFTSKQLLQWVTMTDVLRNEGGARPQIIKKAFAMPKPSRKSIGEEPQETIIDGLSLDQDYVLLVLTSVKDVDSDLSIESDEQRQLGIFLENQLGMFDFNDFFEAYKSTVKVDINL